MDYESILNEAHAAASKAQADAGLEDTYPCGFAWVKVSGNDGLARFGRSRLKQVEAEARKEFRNNDELTRSRAAAMARRGGEKLYGHKSYTGGWEWWKPGGSNAQNVEIHEVGARAFRDKLAEYGISATVYSRLD